MKRHNMIMALALMITLCAVCVKPALAYFTDRDQASGQIQIHLASKAEIKEDFSEWTKHVTIDNTGESEVFLRVKAYAPDGYSLTYSGDDDWSQGSDDYFYYAEPVKPGESTSNLDIKIAVPSEEYDNFDVAVIYESVPALYNESGAAYADWNLEIEEGEVE